MFFELIFLFLSRHGETGRISEMKIKTRFYFALHSICTIFAVT